MEIEDLVVIVPILFVIVLVCAGIFGIHIKDNGGQYVGYVTAVEQNGAIFKGYNVYLKTDLQSSNEDMACINRNDKELIERLKEAQVNKENLTLEYEGMIMYGLGECPNVDWMVIGVK